MQTAPMMIVETEAGFATMTRKFVAMPVRIAATFDGVTEKAIYWRLNNGRETWASVWGEVWVLRSPSQTGKVTSRLIATN